MATNIDVTIDGQTGEEIARQVVTVPDPPPPTLTTEQRIAQLEAIIAALGITL